MSRVGNIDLKSIIDIVIRYFLVIECKNSLLFSFILSNVPFPLLFLPGKSIIINQYFFLS